MAQFPSLVPSQAPITPGSWPMATHRAMDGGRTNVRTGSVENGRSWAPTFENVTEADFLSIRDHYRAHRTRFDRFDFATATLAAALTPSGYSWRWAEAPQVVDQHVDVFTVSCSFICVPRRMMVISRKAWRTAATELVRGAWAPSSGAFESGIALASAATTLVRGAWAGARAFIDGIPWMSEASTLAKGAWSVPVTDPDFSSVSLLLHMEGANNSTTFTDSGPLGLSVTRSGSAGVITTSQSAVGSSSFNVNGDQLNLPANSALTLSGDFTVEWRARHTSLSGKQQYFVNFAGTNVQIAYQGGLFFFPPNVARTLSMTADTWAALAVTRSGSTLYWFKDGTLLGSVTDSTNYNLSGGSIARIGSENMLGFLDEIRITKGVCRYTANYTVSTAPFPDA